MAGKLFYWIDHTGRYEGNSGIQRVVRELAKGLANRSAEAIYVSWNEEHLALARADQASSTRLGAFDGPAGGSVLRANVALHCNDLDQDDLAGSWLIVPEVPHLSNKGRHLTGDVIEYCRLYGIRTAFVFYDLIPISVLGYEDMRENHREYVRSIARADLIMPISEYSANSLRQYCLSELHLPAGELPRIVPISLGVPFADGVRPDHEASDATLRTSIVCVGTIEPRKNQVRLLKAFNQLCREGRAAGMTLTFVGHVDPAVEAEVTELAAANSQVVLAAYLPDSEVQSLYARSRFAVFPSEEEGFGLPIVEALWFGLPVVCANFGVMQEVATGGGCLMVDVRSEDELGRALDRLIHEPAVSSRLAAEARARRFESNSDYASAVLAEMSRHDLPRRIAIWAQSAGEKLTGTVCRRITRALVNAFAQQGVHVDLLEWDSSNDGALIASVLAGPAGWAPWGGPEFHAPPQDHDDAAGAARWLIVPEAPVGPTPAQVVAAAAARGLKTAFLVSDLAPLKLSDIWLKPAAPPIYSHAFADAHLDIWAGMASAHAIIPASAATATDFREVCYRNLTKLADVDDRIAPLLPGGDFTHAPRRELTPRLPSAKPQFLCVSSLAARNNIARLIQAYKAAAPDQNIATLTIVGFSAAADQAATIQRELADRPDVILLSDVDDARLGDLYAAADLTIHPSYDGGGLPILESLWHNTPCLCHDAGAFAELAAGGGALTVDMLDVTNMAATLRRLLADRHELAMLRQAAASRKVRSWRDYAGDLATTLSARTSGRHPTADALAERRLPANVGDRHLLSICVTTFNRAEWLQHSLGQILEIVNPYRDVIEVIVCDNCSTDNTPDVIRKLEENFTLVSIRNQINVGMLGNLSVTARRASGQYVWILGDDDLLVPGAVEDILTGIIDHPSSETIYLNYGYTRSDAPGPADADEVVRSALPIVDGGGNRFVEALRDVAASNENLFTAIYACIFRRDHAIRCYTQDTRGPPFSSLSTCVPSSHYALTMLLDRPAYWVGAPSVVVNMNVSWMRWAPIWHLQRMPDLFNLAERMGVPGERLDEYRLSHCRHAAENLEEICRDDDLRPHFDIEHLLKSCNHLPAFRTMCAPSILDAYGAMFRAGLSPPGSPWPNHLWDRYGLVQGR